MLASAGSVMLRITVSGCGGACILSARISSPACAVRALVAGQRMHLRTVEADADRLPLVERLAGDLADDGAALGADRLDVERFRGIEDQPHRVAAAERCRRRRLQQRRTSGAGRRCRADARRRRSRQVCIRRRCVGSFFGASTAAGFGASAAGFGLERLLRQASLRDVLGRFRGRPWLPCALRPPPALPRRQRASAISAGFAASAAGFLCSLGGRRRLRGVLDRGRGDFRLGLRLHLPGDRLRGRRLDLLGMAFGSLPRASRRRRRPRLGLRSRLGVRLLGLSDWKPTSTM